LWRNDFTEEAEGVRMPEGMTLDELALGVLIEAALATQHSEG
jgi:hypothetical protein